MPVSKECLKLFRKFTDNYEKIGKQDENYTKLYERLKELLQGITSNPLKLKDELVIAFVNNTAIALKASNPAFLDSCQEFTVAYQQETHLLDSFVDENLDIVPKIDFLTEIQTQSKPDDSMYRSPFFIELSAAIASRQKRKQEQHGAEESNSNTLGV